MSALGQKQTFALRQVMPALPPMADILRPERDVRFVPIADMIAPHGLHNHAENSARRTCRAQERSDLSQLVGVPAATAGMSAPLVRTLVLGQSAPGTAYKRKSVLF
jgi:hypothetical protein